MLRVEPWEMDPEASIIERWGPKGSWLHSGSLRHLLVMDVLFEPQCSFLPHPKKILLKPCSFHLSQSSVDP